VGKLKKLLQKIRNNPRQVRFEVLDKILIREGFIRKQPRKDSSHYTYTKNKTIITIPFEQPHIKTAYVTLAIKALEGGLNDD